MESNLAKRNVSRKKFSISLCFSCYSLSVVYYTFAPLYFYCFVKLGDILPLPPSITHRSAYVFRSISFTFLFIALFNNVAWVTTNFLHRTRHTIARERDRRKYRYSLQHVVHVLLIEFVVFSSFYIINTLAFELSHIFVDQYYIHDICPLIL